MGSFFYKPIKGICENIDRFLNDSIILLADTPQIDHPKGSLIVYDTQSLRDLGYPLTRTMMSEVLAKIPKDKKLILDIIYGESKDIKGSSALALSLKSFNAVTLPAVFSEKWIPNKDVFSNNKNINSNIKIFEGHESLETSIPPILDQAHLLAISDFELDEDGLLRWYPLVVKVNGAYVPSIAFQAYLIKSNAKYEIKLNNNLITAIELIFPTNIRREINLNLDPRGLGRIRIRPISFKNEDSLIGISDYLSGNKKIIEDIVFIGATAGGVSLNQPIIGTRMQAPIYNHYLVFNELDSKSPLKTFSNISVIIAFLAFVLLAIGVIVRPLSPMKSILITTLLTTLIVMILIIIYQKDYLIPITPLFFGLVGGMTCNLFKNYSSDQVKKRKMQKSFSNYLHPEIVKNMVEKDREINLGGEEKNISIMFSDLRNFTSLSESITPQELVEIMNQYFDLACKELQNKNGTIDKFIGDAVMAFWNAPIESENFINDSVVGAMNFINEFNKMVPIWTEKFSLKTPVGIGIGIHQGSAIVGNFGSHNRFNYTAIGDAVNLASRVESLCKYYGRELIITEDVYKNIINKELFIAIDIVRVKGKETPAKLYSWANDLSTEEIKIWNLGLQHYFERDYLSTANCLNSLSLKHKISYVILDHIEVHKADANWDGVWDFAHK